MHSLSFSNLVVVDAKGIARGLYLMWNASSHVELVDFNKNTIAVKICDTVCDWHLVGFYGPPYVRKKRKAWENLGALIESIQTSWVCLGDFNFTLNEEERLGGKFKGSSSNNYLQDLMFTYGAVDLGFSSNQFTWAKGNWGKAAIKRRPDRAISSISWRLTFPKATVHHLGAVNSDHTPIVLDTNPQDTFAHRPFRFEAAWIRDPNCYPVIEGAWNEDNSGSEFTVLCKKQENARKALRKWNKEVFGRCQDRINKLLVKITEVQRNNTCSSDSTTETDLQIELAEWLTRSEILWRQKSRELWLLYGDKNSKFFHLSTIVQRWRNNIDAIRNTEGEWISDSGLIRQLFQRGFKEPFTEEEVSYPNNLENLISPTINDVDNTLLSLIPTPDQIKHTLFSMEDQRLLVLTDFLQFFTNSIGRSLGT